MSLHASTFDYLSPTPKQVEQMLRARQAAHGYAQLIEQVMPDGPDRTYALRKLREIAMWVNVAITRNTDGSPRED